MIFFTEPREIEPRYTRVGDEMAIFATHYDQSTPVTPVRSVDLARVGEPLIMWATLTTGPRLIFKATGRFELTLRTDGDEIITIEFGEREQVVIRERLIVEPWDVDCVVAAVDGGACCLPAGHHGGHDSDPAYDGAVPERIDDESVGDGGDLAAPVAVA